VGIAGIGNLIICCDHVKLLSDEDRISLQRAILTTAVLSITTKWCIYVFPPMRIDFRYLLLNAPPFSLRLDVS